jgi:UDP-3-O-[3-hydroxymyristoyl] glucosamine N-acyltransferase
MENEVKGWRLSELASAVGGEMEGAADPWIARPVPAGSDDPEGITFAESKRYLERVIASDVGAVLIARDAPDIPKPAIRVDSPRAAFGTILHLAQRPLDLTMGIHPTAVVSPEARVAASAAIGALCVVEGSVAIGAGARIFPLCYVGRGCVLAENVTLYPGVVLVQDVVIGPGSTIHSGAVLGSDGFGYSEDQGVRRKIPQVGRVVVGPDVEIGANACIDRATCGETVIGRGTKIDNLVQIGHNVSIGQDTVLAGQAGVSGSAQIGDRVLVGGQVAITDHAHIVSDVRLAGRTGVMGDITEPGQYFGTPPTRPGEAMRQLASLAKLPELIKRVRQLEEELAQMRQREP